MMHVIVATLWAETLLADHIILLKLLRLSDLMQTIRGVLVKLHELKLLILLNRVIGFEVAWLRIWLGGINILLIRLGGSTMKSS